MMMGAVLEAASQATHVDSALLNVKPSAQEPQTGPIDPSEHMSRSGSQAAPRPIGRLRRRCDVGSALLRVS